MPGNECHGKGSGNDCRIYGTTFAAQGSAAKALQESSTVLVLSRKESETIVCGEGENQITITIVRISSNVTRVGIEAASHIPIHRGEIYRVIQERREAELRNQQKMEQQQQ